MAEYNELVQAIRYLVLERLQQQARFIHGLLGDGQGRVAVPGRSDYSYVRPNRSTNISFEVFNKEVAGADGWPVLIGELPWQPGLTQVVGTDWAAYNETGWGFNAALVGPHARQHEWPDAAPGTDPLNVYRRSLAEMKTYPLGSGSQSVYVSPYDYDYGVPKSWPGLPGLDLAAASPATGTARLMLTYLDPVSNAIGAVTGSVGVYSDAVDLPRPTLPTGTWFPSAYVRLYGGQSTILERDIWDARRLFSGGIATGTASGGAPSGPAGGDLTGTYPDPRVAGLFGYPVMNTPPAEGNVLMFTGSAWRPSTYQVGGGWPFANITVDPTDPDADFTTIQDAIDSVAVNGIAAISISPQTGMYVGNLTITDKNIALIGMGGDPRGVTGNPGAEVEISGTITVQATTVDCRVSLRDIEMDSASGQITVAGNFPGGKVASLHLSRVYSTAANTRVTASTYSILRIDSCYIIRSGGGTVVSLDTGMSSTQPCGIYDSQLGGVVDAGAATYVWMANNYGSFSTSGGGTFYFKDMLAGYLVLGETPAVDEMPMWVGGGSQRFEFKPLPGHAHTAVAGQGGQLDWDDIWSDAAHSHQAAGEGGQLDHGLALTGLLDDDHTQYILKSLVDAKGDLIGASANDTPARVAVGANGQSLVADSTQATGLSWGTAGRDWPFGGLWLKHLSTTQVRVSAGRIVIEDTECYEANDAAVLDISVAGDYISGVSERGTSKWLYVYVKRDTDGGWTVKLSDDPPLYPRAADCRISYGQLAGNPAAGATAIVVDDGAGGNPTGEANIAAGDILRIYTDSAYTTIRGALTVVSYDAGTNTFTVEANGLDAADNDYWFISPGPTRYQLFTATYYRCVGAFYLNATGSGNISDKFYQQDDMIIFDDLDNLQPLAAGAATTWTNVSLTACIPPISTYVMFYCYHVNTAVNKSAFIRKKGGVGTYMNFIANPTAGGYFSCYAPCPTDPSQFVEYMHNAVNGQLWLWVYGYIALL